MSGSETLVLLWSIKELYICQTPVNMHSLSGKVSVYRTCGRDGGTIGMFHFSKQSKQSEDFLNQSLKSVQWTASLTETWRPALAAGRANNLWDLLRHATPSNCSTERQDRTRTRTHHTCSHSHLHQELNLQRVTAFMTLQASAVFVSNLCDHTISCLTVKFPCALLEAFFSIDISNIRTSV